MSLKMSPDPIIVVFDFDETIAHFDDDSLLSDSNVQRNAEPLLYVRREIFHFLHELRSWWGRAESLVIIWSRGDDCYIQEAVHAINGLASHVDIVWGESQCKKSYQKYGIHKSVDYLLRHPAVIKWLTELRRRRQELSLDNTDTYKDISAEIDLPQLIIPTTVIIDDKAEENAVGKGNLYHFTWTVKPISRHEVALAQSANNSASRALNALSVGQTKLVLVPIICDLIACLCWQQTCNPLMIPLLNHRGKEDSANQCFSGYGVTATMPIPIPCEQHSTTPPPLIRPTQWSAVPKPFGAIL